MLASAIAKKIKRYGLEPGLRRDLSLFTVSCLARGYTILVKKWLGFGANAVAALSVNGSYHSMVNLKYIAARTERFLKKDRRKIAKLLKETLSEFRSIRREFNKISRRGRAEPFVCLAKIITLAQSYFGVIAVYNSFYRYTLVHGGRGLLSAKEFERIGRERNKVASLYPELDKLARRCLSLLAKKEGATENRFHFLTLDEADLYLKGKPITEQLLSKLKARSKNYVHLFAGDTGKEFIVTEPKSVRAVEKEFFFPHSHSAPFLEGITAFRGFARGKVYNVIGKKKLKSFDGGMIFVAPHTDPNLIPFIKRSAAIVTDEGGVLSHAAIISRELKIPCVIGTKVATKILKDGDVVEVNAKRGIVTIIKKRDE